MAAFIRCGENFQLEQIYHFGAGPAMLPSAVLARIREELPGGHQNRVSIMEVSHRDKKFAEIAEAAEKRFRRLLKIPDNYQVLFLQGGASAQFSFVPLNLVEKGQTANYALTGHWSQKAMVEAQRFCKVHIATDSGDNYWTNIADFENWQIDPDGAYFHYTPNETIAGLEFSFVPEVSMPLVADMSSMILSREVEVSKFGVIYAGAQKNIGPAGLTVVIVRDDLCGKKSNVPSVFDYAVAAKNRSMFNTPPTFSWYVAGLVFEWLEARGGIFEIEKINIRKAEKLYRAIDGSAFYHNPVNPKYRSRMNVPFTLFDHSLDDLFLEKSAEAGLLALRGHRSVGGMRASIYNAMPEAGVDALVDFMAEFEKAHG